MALRTTGRKALLASAAITALAASALVSQSAQAAPNTTEEFQVIPQSLTENPDALPYLGSRDSRFDANEETPRIVGGSRAPEGAYPWMARMSISTPKGSFSCGATIVSPDVVISAQHCTEGSSSITIYYGANDKSRQQSVKVTQKVEGLGTKRGDWAVLKLANRINVSSYPTVATNGSYDNGPRFRSMGWGHTSSGGSGSNYLLQVDLPWIDNSKCGNVNEICAGDWDNGGIDTCQGDSGGPLLNFGASRPVLVGIVSWGIGCASPRNPGHYTKVSSYVSQMSSAVSRMGGTPFNGGGSNNPGPVDPGPVDPGPVNPGPGPGNPGGGSGNSYRQNIGQDLANYGSLTSTINVSGAARNSVKLAIDANHACMQHIRIDVTTPDGVVNSVKRSSYANGASCSAWNGTLSDNYPMRTDTNGSWVLRMSDDQGGASGRVNSWSLDFS